MKEKVEYYAPILRLITPVLVASLSFFIIRYISQIDKNIDEIKWDMREFRVAFETHNGIAQRLTWQLENRLKRLEDLIDKDHPQPPLHFSERVERLKREVVQ